jgi:hypothetical protein
MRKLLLTILFTLVLIGGVSADIVQFNCIGLNNNMKSNVFFLDSNNKTVNQQWVFNNGKSGGSKYEILEMDNEKVLIKSLDKKFKNIPPYYWYYATDQRTVYNTRVTLYDCKSNNSNIDINSNSVEIKSKKIIENEQQQNAIMFTIKDKREQCEAIGFKPETDKFADCVLRLVELDVKQQQDQKIASAKSSGNLAVANQLQQMRNDNSSRYLMDLGQQLLKPKQYNSNIYMPQTQRCTLQGFGTFAKMVCR